MDMGVKESNVEQHNMSSDWQESRGVTNTSIGMIQMMETPSCSSAQMVNSFCQPIWDHPIDPGWHPNAMLRGGMFIPPAPVVVPQNLPHFPADSGFIERATRFSCFSGGNFGEMLNPFNLPNIPNPYACNLGEMQGPHEVLVGNASKPPPEMQPADQVKVDVLGNESDEAEFSCRGGQEEMECGDRECSGKEIDSKKRKRVAECKEDSADVQTANEKTEVKHKDDQSSPTSASKPGGSKTGSQGWDQPKEDYIHIRARKGQATNSHSLAERVRREKISERMKFLQDLVPGCSKVTGKAVMLDEIINYVQSLQRQVEFLSMKLATVNPRLDFNIEGFLAKDILQQRAGLSFSLAFPPDMTIPFPHMHPLHPGLIQADVPGLGSSSETIRRPISTQPTVVSGEFKEPASQVPNEWVDELHNVVHMGLNSSAARISQDLSGKASIPPGNLKPEP